MTTIKYRDPADGVYKQVDVAPVDGPPGRGVLRGGRASSWFSGEDTSPTKTTWVLPPYARVTQSAALPVNAGWNQAVWDSGFMNYSGMYDPATYPDSIQIPRTGLYEIAANIQLTAPATLPSRVGLRIYQNGALWAERTAAIIDSHCACRISSALRMDLYDTVSFQVYAAHTTANTALAAQNWAEVFWVGAT